MTFQEIVEEVQHSLARTDSAVVDKIPVWVNRRQRMAAARHNFSFMRTTSQFVTVVGQQAYDLPADFKDDILFYILKDDAYVPLPITSDRGVLYRYSPADEGEPVCVTLEANQVQLWPPKPDAVYTIRRTYYAWPTDLSGVGTNWLTDRAPEVLVAGGVVEGLWFLGADKEIGAWEQKSEIALKRAITYDTGRGLPQEFALIPRLDVGISRNARTEAGWPW